MVSNKKIKTIAIILARGGSKRIPRKNIKPFFGKPIIAYSIEAALKCEMFDEVMVSTDDPEISDLAKKYGAVVPFYRSQETANDFASTFDVIEEVIKKYKSLKKTFDYICCIYACAPFVSANNLNKSLKMMLENKFDSVFPIIPYSFPIQRALRVENDKIDFLNKKFELSRSQDLIESYHDSGQFYWINTKICFSKKLLITDNSGGIIISELEGQDIDNEIDWKLAELKYELLQSTK
jgi:pseudaminic acid cytidylyltransferase